MKCNQCHLHDFHVNCCTQVIIVQPKIHLISENKVFNKYLSVCEKTANFILCSTLCSAISKNEVQTGQILDEKVVIHTHGMHLLSRHIPSKFCVPLGLNHLLQIYNKSVSVTLSLCYCCDVNEH